MDLSHLRKNMLLLILGSIIMFLGLMMIMHPLPAIIITFGLYFMFAAILYTHLDEK